jgi:hypothetical protein
MQRATPFLHALLKQEAQKNRGVLPQRAIDLLQDVLARAMAAFTPAADADFDGLRRRRQGPEAEENGGDAMPPSPTPQCASLS